MFIASQVFVIIGMILDLIDKVLKNKKMILIFMVLASVFYVLSYVFLQNPLAATANGISLFRYIWYLKINEKHKKFKDYIIPMVIINVTFVVAFIFLAKEPLDLILVASMILLSVGLAFSNMNLVRLSIMFNCMLWAFYNTMHGAYANLCCDVLNILLVVGALIYYNYVDKKEKKQMKTVILASGNKHKIAEIKEMFSQNEKTKNYNVIPMSEIGFCDDIEETGTTFEENARIKADAILSFCEQKGFDYAVMSDDSGLCVDALGGAPGIYSARYAGEPVNFQANRDKLLEELKDKTDRTAHFVCSLIFKDNEKEIVALGKTSGRILTQETGKTDFGYDCLFFSDDLQKSFGESTDDEKNSVSHRGRAVANLIQKL